MKRLAIFFFLFVLLFSLAGCATGRKQSELDVQGLRNQITALEAQVQSKDAEINSLKESLAQSQEKQTPEVSAKPAAKLKVVGAVKSRPKPRHIQVALKNAGFDPGPLDGRLGKQTSDAIKAFQRAHNLAVTGKADKKTWNLLRQYLYKKLK